MQWVKLPGVQENLSPKTNELNDRRITNISARYANDMCFADYAQMTKARITAPTVSSELNFLP